jgi:hypothetical protein
MTAVTLPIKLAEKSQPNSVTKLFDTILQSATNEKGFVEWSELTQHLQIHGVCKSKVAAAQYIRHLVDDAKLYELPSWMTCSVVFSRTKIDLPSVYASAWDNAVIKKQQQNCVQELSQGSEHAESRRRNRRK